MNIKALHSGGWHDIFSGGSVRNFIDLRKQAPTAEARSGQQLLMGPWAHAATSPEGKIGDVTFGKQAVLDMNDAILKWYDYVMKGKQNEFATGAPVRIFVMGGNVWRDEQEFLSITLSGLTQAGKTVSRVFTALACLSRFCLIISKAVIRSKTS